ncbi:TetR/AcrR family transcriptional regulator [Solwaraspora sp. WMMB335]|uniref:TetR/AcrR family transcriptional regulator n=1 Tax=Solwaraspora sp. WMMB335 TaxID=3404118 RepID=UPI003B947315
MQAPAARSRSRVADGLTPITVTAIIDAAVSLTVRCGVENWSLRELSRMLDVGPRVIYHHIGDRDAVIAEVVQRVVAELPVPPRDLPWREWFAAMLLGSRPVLRRHRGVARRLVVMGPAVPAALDLMDQGIQVLHSAGFGRGAIAAYRFLINTTFMQIAAEDDRVERHPTARDELAVLLLGQRDAVNRPGLAMVGADIAAHGSAPTDTALVDARFYEYTVSRALDGVAATLVSVADR